MNIVKIKKLEKEAKVPTYATEGAACFDLYSMNESTGCAADIFKTGLAFEIPKDQVMLVFSRSGHGFKQDIRLANCVGVIDSDYRGEVMVKLRADGSSDVAFKAGERIAQAMIIDVKKVSFEVVDDLNSTNRGTGGFGSTGTA